MESSYTRIEKKYTIEEKRDLWEIAIGLNAVDKLEQSPLFYELMEQEIEGKIVYEAMRTSIKEYYSKERESVIDSKELLPSEEADLVAIRMVELLSLDGFTFSVGYFMSTHSYIFQDIFAQLDEKYLGAFRDYDITKVEEVLQGTSVKYSPFVMLKDILEYEFNAEKEKKYYKQPNDVVIKQISAFTSSIWQAHPFVEGNTRTTALFIEKYLKSFQVPVLTDIFKENSLYFRNALVMANAPNQKNSTFEYLEAFFEKCLFDKDTTLAEIKPIDALPPMGV